MALSACGSKNNTDADANYNGTNGPAPVDLRNGPEAVTPEQLDEMILYADDLDAGHAVGALDYLRILAGEARGKAREVIMRKYVDLYGIVLDNHGDDLRGSINQLRDATGIDLKTVYDDFASTLRVGDQDGAGSPEEALRLQADSAKITTVNDDTQSTDTPDATITTTDPE